MARNNGTWHPGMGSHAADRGYAGPSGDYVGTDVGTGHDFAGTLRKRGNDQSADPTIKDKANRKNVQLHPGENRFGPAGKVQMCHVYEGAMSHTDTGRSVKILPSAHGFGDARRIDKGGE